MRVRSRLLGSRSIAEALGPQAFTPFGEASAVSWLGALERRYQIILYRADPFASEWSTDASAADLVLLVGLLGRGPRREAIERLRDETPTELVLLHRHGAAPAGTRRWLERRAGVRTHHHLAPPRRRRRRRIRCAPPVLRLPSAGALGGRAVVRRRPRRRRRQGPAHLGLLRALREEGVPVDIVGGTSQGAFLSGVWALHDDLYNEVGSLSQIRLVVRTFCARMSSIWSRCWRLRCRTRATFPATASTT